MQAAVVILFLAAPVIAGLSLSLEGFVVFLVMAALMAGLSTGQNEEEGEGTHQQPISSKYRGALPYKIDVRFGRISKPAGEGGFFRHQGKAQDGVLMQRWVGGGYPHGF